MYSEKTTGPGQPQLAWEEPQTSTQSTPAVQDGKVEAISPMINDDEKDSNGSEGEEAQEGEETQEEDEAQEGEETQLAPVGRAQTFLQLGAHVNNGIFMDVIGLASGSYYAKLLGPGRIYSFDAWGTRHRLGPKLAIGWFLASPLTILVFFGMVPKNFSWLCLLGFASPIHLFLWYDVNLFRQVWGTIKAKTNVLLATTACVSLGWMTGGDERMVCVLYMFLNMLCFYQLADLNQKYYYF